MSTIYDENEVIAIAENAIFLWQGLMSKIGKGGFVYATVEEEKDYQCHFDGLGQDGGASEMGRIAAVVEAEYFKRRWNNYDFPGVYHYEVIEPLGEWLAEQPNAFRVPEADIRAKYNELMIDFISGDNEEMKTQLRKVVSVTDKLTRT